MHPRRLTMGRAADSRFGRNRTIQRGTWRCERKHREHEGPSEQSRLKHFVRLPVGNDAKQEGTKGRTEVGRLLDEFETRVAPVIERMDTRLNVAPPR